VIIIVLIIVLRKRKKKINVDESVVVTGEDADNLSEHMEGKEKTKETNVESQKKKDEKPISIAEVVVEEEKDGKERNKLDGGENGGMISSHKYTGTDGHEEESFGGIESSLIIYGDGGVMGEEEPVGSRSYESLKKDDDEEEEKIKGCLKGKEIVVNETYESSKKDDDEEREGKIERSEKKEKRKKKKEKERKGKKKKSNNTIEQEEDYGLQEVIDDSSDNDEKNKRKKEKEKKRKKNKNKKDEKKSKKERERGEAEVRKLELVHNDSISTVLISNFGEGSEMEDYNNGIEKPENVEKNKEEDY
jgi:hypothetical protein